MKFIFFSFSPDSFRRFSKSGIIFKLWYHSLKIIPLLENLLNESGEKLKNINFISYTAGPGLIGSLLIGDTVAKTLSKLLDVDLIPINHLEGHILAPCMEYSLSLIHI